MARQYTPLLVKAVNLPLVFTLLVGLSGCATTDVASKNQLLTQKELTEKDCYSYDTHKENLQRNLITAIPLGVLGLVLNPLGSLAAAVGSGIASQANAQNALPTKCSLTVDEAIQEASAMAFIKDSTAIWRRVRDDGSLVLKASPLYARGECSVQSLEITKEAKGQQARRFSDKIEVCKDKNGLPVIAKRSAGNDGNGQIRPKETLASKNTSSETSP